MRRKGTDSLLARTSRLFTVGMDYRATVSQVATMMAPELADWCVVETVDADGSSIQVAVAALDPGKQELAQEIRRRYPPVAGHPDLPQRVLTTGRPELIPAVSDALMRRVAQNAEHLSLLRRLGPGSLLVVPLRTGDRVLGTILLANRVSGRRFVPEDIEVTQDLAAWAAVAIDHAALHRLEQRARRAAERTAKRIERLEAVTAALSRALRPSVIAEVLVGHAAAAVSADGGYVRLLTEDAGHLALTAAVGTAERGSSVPGPLPVTSPRLDAVVFRSGAGRFLQSGTEVRAASPEHAAAGHAAIAFVMLHGFRGPLGLMALTFADERRLDHDDRAILRAMADQCAQALGRARLYEAEREARATAELAVGHTRRLQVLAAELSAALTLGEVADVVVAQGIAGVGADAGALQLLSDDGSMLEVVCGRGPDRALIEGGWRRFPADLRLPSGDALRTLEPIFVESESDVRAHYPDMDEYPAVLGPRARAGVHAPLVVSGRPLGVLFLGFSRARRFSEAQRSFVQTLARQGAQAVRRAQLYEAELERRDWFGRLVERLHEGVVSVDQWGRVEFASSTAKRMLAGASLQEGRPVPETWLGFGLRDFVARLFDADAPVVEAQVAGEDGGRVFDLTGIPAAGSEAVLVVVTDVSAREQRRRAEREFIDNAAHELRTPLAAITGAVERLRTGAREDPERRDRFLGHIQHESARLNRLVSSLLVLARVQTGEEQPQREEIALCGLLEELAGELEPQPGVEVRVECPRGLVAWTNRDLLEHALLNLTDNAARHTTAGVIRIGACLGEDGAMRLEVSDTGRGIAPEELGRLFDRFYRGPGDGRRDGSGLGLPITKDAVEAIGGRVEIDSVPGEGTTARIVLPPADVVVGG